MLLHNPPDRYILLDTKDPQHYSLVQLGEYAHMSNAMTNRSVGFFQRQYNLTVGRPLLSPLACCFPRSLTRAPRHPDRQIDYVPQGQGGGAGSSVSDIALYVHTYLSRLYMPTHARFGPMALGACVAFLLPGEQFGGVGAPTVRPTTSRTIAAYVVQIWAVATMAAVCIPPPEGGKLMPGVVHLVITAGLRNLFASATAVLLYGALSPVGSSFHSPRLAAALSWRSFLFVATCSYALNMFHFRVLMDAALASRRDSPPPTKPTHGLLSGTTFRHCMSSDSYLTFVESGVSGPAAGAIIAAVVQRMNWASHTP